MNSRKTRKTRKSRKTRVNKLNVRNRTRRRGRGKRHHRGSGGHFSIPVREEPERRESFNLTKDQRLETAEAARVFYDKNVRPRAKQEIYRLLEAPPDVVAKAEE